VKYHYKQRGRGLFFASIAADGVANGDAAEQLSIGGDNGLRGYPTRYQTGTQRALMTVEQRLYTDWFPFRLFRIGAAVFFDYGRAWGGEIPNTVNPGWLGDVGVGVRIFSDRSASGRVLHIDLAFPTHRDPGIDSYQILVKSKSSF
jgi:hemolysin activation/secretion protein